MMELLKRTIEGIKPLDQEAMAHCRARLDSLTKPLGSLGALEDIAVTLAGITGNPRPVIREKVVVVMAGDHGVTAQGVSAYPSEVTPQMVLNFGRGGAGINVLARHAGARVTVVDLGVDTDLELPGVINRRVRRGTNDLSLGPAMSRAEAVQALEAGIVIAQAEVDRGADLLATGDMGIGNTTPSSALLAAFSRRPATEVVGRGTGITDQALANKIAVINRALEINRPDPEDPVGTLTALGGCEIAGLAGLVLGAAFRGRPVVIDGFISSAAALAASRICPRATSYMIASHLSEEPGHRIMLEEIGLEPVLRLRLRLGEGTGAALAFHLVEAATKILNEMATFEEAGVSGAL